jgi:hypothetical protein
MQSIGPWYEHVEVPRRRVSRAEVPVLVNHLREDWICVFVLVELLFDVNFAILQDEMELISVRVTICGECLCVGCEKSLQQCTEEAQFAK